MGVEAFEYVIELANQRLDEDSKSLIGFEARFARVEKQLRLLSDPVGLADWAKKNYKGQIPAVFSLVADQYPLFVLEGDVGTGKTAFAKCAASRLCLNLKREGHLFALSTRVRGAGKVGEASTRINEAFEYITAQLGKSKLVFLLIDEADSLLTHRSDEHSHLEDKVAVNTIIQKVDHLREHAGRLIVFLATNRFAALDPGILRRVTLHETFGRPSDSERRELLEQDLAGLGISPSTISEAVAKTGAANGLPGFTYSDFRTRLFPKIVMSAYPDRPISDRDVLDAVASTTPSASIT